MADRPEQTSEALAYSVDEARWVWEQAALVYRLHGELASHYRNGGKDKRAIRTLWEKIDAGEASLRLIGVRL